MRPQTDVTGIEASIIAGSRLISLSHHLDMNDSRAGLSVTLTAAGKIRSGVKTLFVKDILCNVRLSTGRSTGSLLAHHLWARSRSIKLQKLNAVIPDTAGD